MSRAGVRKFTYDTVFTKDGRVVRAPEEQRVSFTRDEIKEARSQGFAEGEKAAEARVGLAVQAIVEQVAALKAGLDATCAGLRRDAVELGLASARAAAEAAVARCPEESLLGLFAECAESLRGAPVVTAHAPAAAVAAVRERIAAFAQQAGLEGAIVVAEGVGPARLEWSGGAAEIDPESALAQAREAAERWLAAADRDADQLNLFAERSGD
jgi:hypothetical protein